MTPLTRTLLRDAMVPWHLADVDLDFIKGIYRNGSTISNSASDFVTCSRASVAYSDSSSGVWSAFSNNVLRVTDRGLRVEAARSNFVKWCRDLTNAVWVKSNVTAALDQTGIDGLVNSASSIVATADNGTILQSTTIGSSARLQSAFVKRVTGTGAVFMTMDGGATWADISASLIVGVWTRAVIPTQNLANPSFGFKVATSGDKIAIDFVQNENSASSLTSPILTTTVAVTRALDVVTLTNLPVFNGGFSLFVEIFSESAPDANRLIVGISDGTLNNEMRFFLSAGGAQYGETVGTIAGGAIFDPGSPAQPGEIDRVAVSGILDKSGYRRGRRMPFNGQFQLALRSPVVSDIRLGSRVNGSFVANATLIRRVAIWSSNAISPAASKAASEL